MKTVSQYEELAPLISAQFRRGVRTNAFFSRQELEGLIAREELSVQETGAGLLLLVERPWFDRLHFYHIGPSATKPTHRVQTRYAMQQRVILQFQSVHALCQSGLRIYIPIGIANRTRSQCPERFLATYHLTGIKTCFEYP